MVILTEKKKVKKNLSKEAIKHKTISKAPKKKPKAAKKAPKAKPVVKKKETIKSKDYTTPIAIIAAVAAVILIAVFMLKSPNMDQGEVELQTDSDINMVLVTINGEDITQEDIDFIYSRIPEENKAAYNEEVLLDQLITEKLLMQEATKNNVEATDEEIQEFIDLIIASNQITEELLILRLQEQGLELDDLRLEVEKQIILTKLVNEEIEVDNFTDEELMAYYNSNPIQFIINPESVNASHILICYDESVMGCDANRTQAEAEEKVDEIISMIDDTNFAEIAIEYSDGPSAPNGGNLGYFTRGQMVEGFETAAFELDVDEVSEPVLTQFGYHIIKVFDKQDEEVVPFEDVKESIQMQLQSEARQELFQDYVDELREKADII